MSSNDPNLGNTGTRESVLLPIRTWSLAIFLLLAGIVPRTFAQYQFTTYDDPNGIGSTQLVAIDGTNILGDYTNSSGANVGFVLSGTTLTDYTGPAGAATNYFLGISGSNILGFYTTAANPSTNHYYILSGSSYSLLSPPAEYFPLAISGTEVVGQCNYNSSFTLTGTTYTNLNNYDAFANGVSNGVIVGVYAPYGPATGFIYSGGTFTYFRDPSDVNNDEATTSFSGISGDNIAGWYEDGRDERGFVLTGGTTWTPLDDPLGTSTSPAGISGNTVVGDYTDSSGVQHGFIASPVPEPGAIGSAVCAIGLLFLLKPGVRSRPG